MAKRIVSLEPSITAMLYALDQADRIVAVSRYCHRLVDVADKPTLPSTWSITPEDVAVHRPDLVIASVPYAAESMLALLKASFNLLCLYPKRLADLYLHIGWLAGITAVPHRGQQLIGELEAEFEAIRQRTTGGPRPRIYCEMWPKPPMCSPAWVAEMVEIAGGRFVPLPTGREVTAAEMQVADPELIVVAWAGVAEPKLEQVARRPGWQEITAVREKRITAVSEIHLNAPGPNLLEGTRRLATAIAAVRRS